MADNNLTFKVTAKADGEEVIDLAKNIDKLKQDASKPINLDVKVNDAQNELNELNQKSKELAKQLDSLQRYGGVQVHGEEIEKLKKELQDIDKRKLELYAIIDDAELANLKKDINSVQKERIDIDIDADTGQIKTVHKEIDDLKGENVDINVNVDDSEIKNAQKEVEGLGDKLQSSLGSTESAITGAISGMAGKSIWDTIYGTSKKAETNKILLKNMADTSIGYEDLYKTIDSTTDQSLISMQQLIPALNGIKAATGSNASTINTVTPQVASFGQYVYALSGSASKAETAMFDLSKGIKGAFASLDQYGVTEDALMRTGLWTGKEDDVTGYMNAVQAVTGDTQELMGTAEGLEAQLGKAFSRGGKRIGEDLLPQVKNLLNGFMQLDTSTDGWLSTGLLLGGGALSGITSFLSMAGQAINGAKMLRDAYYFLIPAQYAEGTAGWFSIGWLAVAIALGIALGLAILYLYNNVDWFREGMDNLIASLQWFVNLLSSSVIGTIQWLMQEFQNFTNQLGLNSGNWIQSILAFILFLPQLPFELGLALINAIAKAAGFGNNFVQTMWNAGVNAVNGFISSIVQMGQRLYQELMAMLKMAEDFAMQIADTMTFGGASMVTGWQYGSGEHSPGFMYDSFTGELEAMKNSATEQGSGLTNILASIGSRLNSNFGEHDFNVGFNNDLQPLNYSLGSRDDNPTQIININLEVGTVDNEERANEIVELVRRSLAWDNKTAGRTI